jgi:hypothetical protein
VRADGDAEPHKEDHDARAGAAIAVGAIARAIRGEAEVVAVETVAATAGMIADNV